MDQIGRVQVELASLVPQLKITLIAKENDATQARNRARFQENNRGRPWGFWLYHPDGMLSSTTQEPRREHSADLQQM